LQRVQVYFLRQLLLRGFPDRPQFRIRPEVQAAVEVPPSSIYEGDIGRSAGFLHLLGPVNRLSSPDI
jgi:hypothetical protein